MLPFSAMEPVIRVYMFGKKKYAKDNWRKGMAWSRAFNSAMRHLTTWWEGEDNDPESGLSHLAHAAWNVITLLAYLKLHPNKDDRQGSDEHDKAA